MKRTLIAAAGLALVAASGMAEAASWSIVVEPGVFGRVAIGGYATAPLVYEAQPVVALGDGQVVEQAADPRYVGDDGGVPVYSPPADVPSPVYLWVPEWQRTHWAQACNGYGACGVPVYFVQDGWYRDNVMRRAWTPEQRSWSQAQWIEQDRIARERWERERWNRERGWHQTQPWRVEQQRSQEPWQREQQRPQDQWQREQQRPQEQWQREQQRSQQANWDRARDDRDRAEHDRMEHDRADRERADRERQDRQRWEQSHGQHVQPVAEWQPGQALRAQPGEGSHPPVRQGDGRGGWNGDRDHGHGNAPAAGQGSAPAGNAPDEPSHPNAGRGNAGRNPGGNPVVNGNGVAGGNANANANGNGNGNGRDAGRGTARDDGHDKGQGQARGQYEHHPGGNVDR